MKKNNMIFIGLILIAGIMRLIPHPWNFTPVLAACLFSGYKIKPIGLALFLPLVAVLLGDFTLGLYEGIGWVYTSYLLVIALAIFANKRNTVQSKGLTVLGGSLVFFLISNFGVWMSGYLYPKTFEGLVACYIAAIPFYKNTLIGTVLYSGVFFTIAEYLENSIVRFSTSKN